MTSLPGETPKKLGLVIDLDTCVGCQACVTSCKEWNTGGYSAPLSDHDPYGADPSGAFLNRAQLRDGDRRTRSHGAFPALLPALRGARLRHRLSDGRQLQASRGRDRSGQSRHLHRLQAVFLGLSLRRAGIRPRRRRDEEMHALRGSHLQRHLPEEDREPACVRACPTGARAFGDLGDPDSDVSRSVADRGGFDLLEEFGYKPVNKYLPPRAPAVPTCGTPTAAAMETVAPPRDRLERLFAWIDQRLSD
jgi:Fe-S-cluster-containing dehydrogenase component